MIYRATTVQLLSDMYKKANNSTATKKVDSTKVHWRLMTTGTFQK